MSPLEELQAKYGAALKGEESWSTAVTRVKAEAPGQAAAPAAKPQAAPKPAPPKPQVAPKPEGPKVPLTLAPPLPPPDTRGEPLEPPVAPAPSGMSPEAFSAMGSPFDAMRKAVASRLRGAAPDQQKLEELQAERGWR